ncbi:MAG: hypothetical protein OEL79_00310 [Chromatiales bacterium]|nr:hypothetical protein [Chromatiales bacterium]
MRIKSKWHKKGAKTTEEIAQTAAYIIWKIAKSTVDKMYVDGFNFKSNQRLLGVIGEFVSLMLQAAGQITYESMTPDEFAEFINITAKQLAHTMADNLSIENPPEQFADDAKNFINHLNQRLSDYSEFSFGDNGEPSYPALRFFGNAVEQQMEGSDSKWVSEQVMEVEAPIVIKELKKGLSNILAHQDE